MRVGECLKHLKRGWNRKERKGHKDFKKGGGPSWVKRWVPYKGGLEHPYKLCLLINLIKSNIM